VLREQKIFYNKNKQKKTKEILAPFCWEKTRTSAVYRSKRTSEDWREN